MMRKTQDHESVLTDFFSILLDCEEYFDKRADADMDQDGYVPNEEMKLLISVREVMMAIEREIGTEKITGVK